MSTRNVILIIDSDLATAALEILEDYELVFADRQPIESQLITLCQQHNPLTILVRYGKITAVVMDAAPALKVTVKYDGDIDVISVETAAACGIMVHAATEANTVAASERTWVLILACAKSVVPPDHRLREGHRDKLAHKPSELEDGTPGLVDLGAISSHVAKTAVIFGMKVLTYDPYAKTVPPGCGRVGKLKDLLM